MPLTDSQQQRVARLAALEALWDGTRHKGKPSFWDPETPLAERAPAVQTRQTATDAGRLIAMVFGASKWPTLALAADQPDRDAVAALLAELERTLRMPRLMRRVLTDALKVGTAVPYVRVREGVPCVEMLPAKHCWPTLDAYGAVVQLEILYATTATDEKGNSYPALYRRVLDAQRDTEFVPVPLEQNDPEWIVRGEPIEHGLGFVPVLWHRNRRESYDPGLDGIPLGAGTEQEELCLDLTHSQAHRNARYNGEPQMVVTGVEEGKPLGAQGRPADPKRVDWAESLRGLMDRAQRGGSALKKAPGTLWRLENPGADAKMLESNGAGGVLLQADADRLRRLINDQHGVVLASPEQIGANASAALLHELFAPQVDTCDQLREEYGELLVQLLNLLLRVLTVAAAAATDLTKQLKLRRLEAALPALRAQLAPDYWHPVEITLAWGDYFQPTWTDVVQGLGAAEAATGGKALLTRKAAVKLIAPLVQVRDVEAYLRELDAEQTPQSPRDVALGASGVDAPVVDASIQDTALNGAQVTSLLGIVEKVSAGALPDASALVLIQEAFPGITAQRAAAILAPLRRAAPNVNTP